MNTDRIRDALRLAAAGEPVPYDRADAALQLAARRRRTKVVGVSCATAVAAVVASVTLTGAGPSSLRPIPVTTPTETVTPTPDGAGPTADPTQSAGPASAPGEGGASPAPAGPAGTPMCDYEGFAAPCGATVHKPPRPENLDIFVLLDGTGSMDSAWGGIAPALRRIDARLRAGGNTVGWGYGIYRDTTVVNAADEGDARIYRTVQRISVSSRPDLTQAHPLGGGDDPDAATVGLDGLLGVGHFPYSSDGDDAGFRPGAHKIVLLMTDATIKQGDQYPPIDDVLTRLNAADVDVVALQALTGYGGSGNEARAHADLVRVVRGTGALTPVAVYCEGEPGHGEWDLARDDPLICPFDGDANHGFPDLDAYADALLAMVRAGR
jgi:hypothetical protein